MSDEHRSYDGIIFIGLMVTFDWLRDLVFWISLGLMGSGSLAIFLIATSSTRHEGGVFWLAGAAVGFALFICWVYAAVAHAVIKKWTGDEEADDEDEEEVVLPRRRSRTPRPVRN